MTVATLNNFSVNSVHTHVIKLETEKMGLLKKMKKNPRDTRVHDEIIKINAQIVQFQLVARAFMKERR